MPVDMSARYYGLAACPCPPVVRTHLSARRAANNRYSRGADFTICPRLVKDTPWFPLSPNITASIKG